MRFAMALLAMGLLAAPVMAEANIAGHWTFTANIQQECSFGGTAHLEKTGETTFEGELTATQSCVSLPEDYIVRQDCSASQLGNQLSVRCRIVEFINGFDSAFW
ncbi:MAG: hypothetical protein AAF709_26175, partial [Pseudomonadota bacterium]